MNIKDQILKIREDFPILFQNMNDKPLVYLDNAATSQKPKEVLDEIARYYTEDNSNVHRGAYQLSQRATEDYESVRNKVCHFINTRDTQEIIFTKGTTEAINLISQSWGNENILEGDDVIVTRMEHHANFVPWQALARRKKANFKIVELNSNYEIDFNSLKEALSNKPKVLAITLMSNVLGTINPIKEIATLAKEKGALVVVDAAQAVSQMKIDIASLGPIDFLAFSAHKMCGPTGVGVLWGKKALLDKMHPYQYGGDMILNVMDQETKWNQLPWKFEAGTPNIEGVIALGATIDYLEKIGMDSIKQYDMHLTALALEQLQSIEGLNIIGPKSSLNRGSSISFTLDDIHPHDLATFLDQEGIATRAGHHCAQPLVNHLGLTATTRASFYFYNTEQDVYSLKNALIEAKRYFQR